MKILHTSDWHLGRTLYGRRRYEEFAAFLDWLAQVIKGQGVEALLVAGDVFDTSTPGNRAQELYYRFLCRVAASCCRHVVVIAGNHDSPTFLAAPKELLRALDIHVVGMMSEHSEDEVLVLKDRDGRPELIVCAVPFLRDRDIRVAEPGESIEDKDRRLIEGIRDHYAAVAAAAEQRRQELAAEVPVVAMGHLFTAGGRTVDSDGVRELYVGSLAHVPAAIFPPVFDYLALGHLHVPQAVGGAPTARYSGSPLPMGFGEAGQDKSLCLLESTGRSIAARLLPVPLFQRIERLRGNWEQLAAGIEGLWQSPEAIWLEVVYEGAELAGDLRERLAEAVAGTAIEILRVKNNRFIEQALGGAGTEESLDDLAVDEVFERCLALHEVPEEQAAGLRLAYREIVAAVAAADPQAEQEA